MAAYAMEKKRAKNPERFGKGALEGVAGTGNGQQRRRHLSFIPLLTLGIPANATMALMFGALLIQGVTPGPQLVEQHPDLFWGVVNSMYIGNILLLIMCIPLVGVFVRILRVRAAILAPITALITLLGAYTINNRCSTSSLVVVFGVVGYLMKKFGFEPGPLVLAFVLGALLESQPAPVAASVRRRPVGVLRPADFRSRCCSSSSWSPCGRSSGPCWPTPAHPRGRHHQDKGKRMSILVGFVPTPVGEAAARPPSPRPSCGGEDLFIVNSVREGALVDKSVATERILDEAAADAADAGVDASYPSPTYSDDLAEEVLDLAGSTTCR